MLSAPCIETGNSNIYRSTSSTGNRPSDVSSSASPPIDQPATSSIEGLLGLAVTDSVTADGRPRQGVQVDHYDENYGDNDNDDDDEDHSEDNDDYDSDDMPASGDVSTFELTTPGGSFRNRQDVASDRWSQSGQIAGPRGALSTRPPPHSAKHRGIYDDKSAVDEGRFRTTPRRHDVIDMLPGVVDMTGSENVLSSSLPMTTPKLLPRRTTGPQLPPRPSGIGSSRTTPHAPTPLSAAGPQRRPAPSSASTSASRRNSPHVNSASVAAVSLRTGASISFYLVTVFHLVRSLPFEIIRLSKMYLLFSGV